MSNKEPLLRTASAVPRLYDTTSMLEMDMEVARGFVVLLGGAPAVEKRSRGSKGRTSPSPDDGAITLGFLALTEGNTVEACFGVSGVSKDDAGKKFAREVKNVLADAVDSNEDIRRISVVTYQEAFRIIVKFGEAQKRLNCITRCFRFVKVKKTAVSNLRENFQHLEEAIQAAL